MHGVRIDHGVFVKNGGVNVKTELFVEFAGKQTDVNNLIDMARETWKAEGKPVKDIELLQLYFKPEERNCYIVINGADKGSFQV